MFRRGIKRSVFGRTPQHYRAIPLVNLLPDERRAPMQLFGAEGTGILVRLGLVALIVLAGVVALVSRQQETQSANLEANAHRGSGTALVTVDQALDLQAQIDALKEAGNVGAQDYAFLLGNPGALVDALQSVFALQVDGIVILNIATEDAGLVSVRLHAASNEAALEWRRLIGSSPGVSRVLSFDPVSLEDGLGYDVTLVSGGQLMLKRIVRHRIDILLIVVAGALVAAAVMAVLQGQEARTAYLDALNEQRDIEAEAAQYNISGMISELDRLSNGDGESAVPLRGAVELKISEIARLITESGMKLGPIVQGELTTSVANEDIGLSAEVPEPRTYEGIELALSLDGDVEGLLGLSDRILSNVPEATFSDIVVTQSTASDDASLSLRVLLYHQPS